jgi:hypothetical protein
MASFLMPSGAMDKVNEATVEFTTQFSKYMLLGFFDVAISQAKANADAKSESDDTEQLMKMPVPDWTIKSAYFTKEGGKVHNWKNRWFVANNKTDQFTIDYYTDENMKTKKGTINCAGYRARKSELKKPNGIILEPWDNDRREWAFCFATAEERDRWLSIFENGCWHSEPTGDPDPMINKAFRNAFNKLRVARGFWYSFSFDRSPHEMLAKLLIRDMERSIFRDILAEVNTPGGIGQTTARNAVRKMLVATCTGSCKAAWQGCKPSLDLAKTVVKEKVIPQIQPIVDAQNTLRDKIVDTVGTVASPVTTVMQETIFSPLLDRVLAPMVEVFNEAIKGFHRVASKEWGIEKVQDEKVFREMIDDTRYSYYHKSPMVEAYQKIRNLNDSVLDTFCSEVKGLNAYYFTWTLDSLCRGLLRNAIYTMYKLSKDGTDPAAAFTTTMEQLVHDAKLAFTRVVREGFRKMVNENFDQNLIQPCVKLVAPIQESIPEMFNTLISIDGLLEEALNMMVDNLIEECTAKSSASAIDGISSVSE